MASKLKLKHTQQKETGVVKQGDVGSLRAKTERQQVECLKRREPEARAGVSGKERACHSSSYQGKVKLVIRAEQGCWN